MNFQKIKFEQQSTQRVYENYLRQIEQLLKPLAKEEQEDILMELNSHIYERMQRSKLDAELDCLLDTIESFGDLDAILKPIVAERKLDQATRTFNPAHIFKALVLNIQNGVFFVLITICYIGLGGFCLAVLSKLIGGDKIGMFYKPGEYFVLAGIPGTTENEMEYELLGDWYIPVMLSGLFFFYVLITLILRLEKSLRKKTELKLNYQLA